MFESNNHFTDFGSKDLSIYQNKSEPDFRRTYKTKSSDKKPYLIHLEQFGDDYYFVKFHPSKHSNNPDKYKLRIQWPTLPVRILSTCIQIIIKEMTEEPDKVFCVYGQWDSKDVENESNISQRYKLWLQIAVSKINPEKYVFLRISIYNIFMVVPKEKNTEEYIQKTAQYFQKRFSSSLDQLKVPSKIEYETFHVNN